MKCLLFVLLLFALKSSAQNTQTSLVFSSGVSLSKEPGLFYSAGLSFKDMKGGLAKFRVEISARYFDYRLAVENRFGVEVSRFYGFAFFQLVPKNARDKEKATDVSNNIGAGLLYLIPLIDGNVVELGIAQSFGKYAPDSRIQFFSIGVVHKL